MEKAEKDTTSKNILETNIADIVQKETPEKEVLQYSIEDAIKAQKIAEKAVIESIKNIN